MNDEGFSTVMDAILFLALVCVCAVILGPAVAGHVTERSAADRGLREIAADVLCSLETEQVDYFEYRVLGNVADSMAAAGGINASGDILYKDMTRALLGRGDRHRAVMDLAAGDAACQFILECMDTKVRANPVTVEYDSAVAALIDRAVRSSLDSRYGYEFTLRWTPLTGVPLVGEVRAGTPCPGGAASSSLRVSMPYTTGITRSSLERIIEDDLEAIGQTVDEYRAGGDESSLESALGNAIERSLRNSTMLALGEIWNNTLGASVDGTSSNNPLNVLKRFIDGKTPDPVEMMSMNSSVKDLAGSMADLYYHGEAERLTGEIAGGIAAGRLDGGDARRMVLEYLYARYEPSGAIATLSLWTGAYA